MALFSLLPKFESQNSLLRRHAKKDPPPFLYAVGLISVFLALLLLPLFYMAIVSVTVILLFHHLTENFVWLLQPHTNLILISLYFFFTTELSLLAFFLIRPLLPNPQFFKKEIELFPQDEPRLFQFVYQICSALSTPVPVKIFVNMDINASARFAVRVTDILRGRFDLILGLPLVRGLDLSQFAGVLAHELGHFRQGLGMRLVHIIRAYNHWFMQESMFATVHEKTTEPRPIHWEKLFGLLTLNAELASFFVQKFLMAYAQLGKWVSGLLLHQMEHEADRNAIRLVGGETFASMVLEAKVLEASWTLATRSLGLALREGRLADDLPALVTAQMRVFIPEIRSKMERNLMNEKTIWYHTHPSLAERVRNARYSLARGMFHAKGRAKLLFSNFDLLSKKATLDFYRQDFGNDFNPSRLIATDTLISDQSEIQIGEAAIGGYFLGLLSNLRPIWISLASLQSSQTFEQLKIALIATRTSLSLDYTDAKPLYEGYNILDQNILELSQAQALLNANFMIEPADFNLPNGNIETVLRTLSEKNTEQQNLGKKLVPFENVMTMRLILGLSLLKKTELNSHFPQLEKTNQTVTVMLLCLNHLEKIFPNMISIRQKVHAAVMLLENFSGNERATELQYELKKLTQFLRLELKTIIELLNNSPYPFTEPDSEMLLADYLVKNFPDENELLENCEVAEEALSRYFALYFRIIGQWAMLAGRVEGFLDLGPLQLDQEG